MPELLALRVQGDRIRGFSAKGNLGLFAGGRFGASLPGFQNRWQLLVPWIHLPVPVVLPRRPGGAWQEFGVVESERVRDFYGRAYQRCRISYRDFLPARAIQEILQAWKLLGKWWKWDLERGREIGVLW